MNPRALGILLLLVMVTAFLTPGCSKADPDMEVIDRLKTQGVDVTKPQTVDFFLYFGSEQDVNKAADQVRPMGFEIEIRPPRGSAPDWLCRATKSMVPEPAELRALRLKFDSVATAQGGMYDGWSIAKNP